MEWLDSTMPVGRSSSRYPRTLTRLHANVVWTIGGYAPDHVGESREPGKIVSTAVLRCADFEPGGACLESFGRPPEILLLTRTERAVKLACNAVPPE